jgi:hypothetical protein
LHGRAIWTVNIRGWFFWAVAGVAGGVYDAMQSDKGIEKRGEWIAILIYMSSYIIRTHILNEFIHIMHTCNFI